MNIFALLFSFRGRINRAKFWLAVLIYFIYLVILATIAYWYELEGGAFVVLAILAIPIWVSGFAVGIKRLHEDILSLLLSTAGFALTIWVFVELGCLRGTPGPNRYGPDPLAKPAA